MSGYEAWLSGEAMVAGKKWQSVEQGAWGVEQGTGDRRQETEGIRQTVGGKIERCCGRAVKNEEEGRRRRRGNW